MTALKKAGVMGWPVAHSLSPALHEFWLKQYGIAGSYEALPVPPDKLAEALRMLKMRGFAGCNLTIPHKAAALPLMTRLDASARRIGAVNTVVVDPDGTLLGSNTDGFGFIENLRAASPGFNPRHGPAVVLGAGGAARAILCALIDAGAPEIRLVNRSPERARTLGNSLDGPIRIGSWEQRAGLLAGAGLLVNATSLGMTGQPSLDIALENLPTTAVVNDIIYAPVETPLLQQARMRGLHAVDGLGMLLHQARPGFTAWFGVEPRVTPELRRAVLAARP